MSKNFYKGYLILAIVIVAMMSLSKPVVEQMRGIVASFLSPIRNFSYFKKDDKIQEEVKRLQLENQLLHSELERVQEFAIQERQFHEMAKEYLSLKLQAFPAQVIFRTAGLWNSSLWLNVGTSDNQKLEGCVIAKNSPVVVGTSVIGVVDYVGKHQCRVRLITDSGLNPSVRVVRGSKKNRLILEKIDSLIDLADDSDLIEHLIQIKGVVLKESSDCYLAKGELMGSSYPLWRSLGQRLKGIGFNYDFEDKEGFARDLRTGLQVDSPINQTPIALICKDDLLVTTGMDGVFPEGLPIARVVSVNPLKEGDYFYEIEAVPTAGNLNGIQTVLVLPPVGYDPIDRPPVIGW